MWHTGAMVDSDTLVIYGGQSWSNAKTFFNDIWAYSISKNTWTQLKGAFPGNAPGTRTGGAAVGCNSKFYIFGGQPDST
jgi:N-acetylneuraminic acid mutarotase